jgi:hypothetical protein
MIRSEQSKDAQREAGKFRRMASNGVQDVLAMKIAQTRPSGATEDLRELVFRTARENPTWGEMGILL